jgi:hypothetical protein
MRIGVIALVLWSLALPAYGKKEDSLEDLIKRAESARLQDQPSLYIELAQRRLKDADDLYTAGKTDEARVAIEDVVTYADRATAAATKSGKKLKNTEIAVRKMAARLRDLKRTLSFDDQPPVQAAADHLEKMRTELLTRMFGSKE